MYTLYFVVKKVMDNAGMFYVEGTTPFYYGARMIEKKLGNFDSSYLKAFSFGPLVYSVTFFFMKKKKGTYIIHCGLSNKGNYPSFCRPK